MNMTEEDRVKKAHIALMRHPETALYSGVMMMGETSIDDNPKTTAYTDGVNKRYGRKFLEVVCKDQLEVNGLVLHENLHIALRQMLHHRDLWDDDAKLANKAADFVVNSIIMNLKDKSLAKLPEGGCYDPRFDNMNTREVYRILKKEGGGGGGGGGGGSGNNESGGDDYQFDEHDVGKRMTPEEMKDMDGRIDRALREGALLAGRLGVDIPRSITEILEPKIDWRDALRDFVTSSCKGKDEYTWRRFNRRLLPNDLYMPTVESETIGEIIVAIDTSGSIGQEQINEFASELVSICDSVSPESVRILWWDTRVHGEQVFTDNYSAIGEMLKPLGGGGTEVGCVSKYINKQNLKPECVLVFTDGYVENSPTWSITSPTLWLVTLAKDWVPPAGKKVMFN